MTVVCSMAAFGKLVEPRTRIPSMKYSVLEDLEPRILRAPPSSAWNTPAVVAAIELTSLVGNAAISSLVTVPPVEVSSLEIRGTS